MFMRACSLDTSPSLDFDRSTPAIAFSATCDAWTAVRHVDGATCHDDISAYFGPY